MSAPSALDDTVIWGALSLMADSKDECISKLAQRLRDRVLYKSIDVRAKIAHDKDNKGGGGLSGMRYRVCEIWDEISGIVDELAAKAPDDTSPPSPHQSKMETLARYKELTEDAKGP